MPVAEEPGLIAIDKIIVNGRNLISMRVVGISGHSIEAQLSPSDAVAAGRSLIAHGVDYGMASDD